MDDLSHTQTPKMNNGLESDSTTLVDHFVDLSF